MTGPARILAGSMVLAMAGCDTPTRPSTAVATQSVTITDGSAASQLIATSFSVIEVQRGSTSWEYAPQVTVREITGASTATVTIMTFQIPGLGSVPPMQTSKCLMPSTERSLLNEQLGDFELTISSLKLRATGSTATGTLTYVDSKGRQGQLSLSGPIVRGDYPSTYTPGSGDWGCGTRN